MIFFAIWSVREIVIQPIFLSPLGNFTSSIIGAIIKLLVWTLPAILLIRRFNGDMFISFEEMFTTKPRLSKCAPFLAIIFVVPLIQAILWGGEIAIDPSFVPTRLIGAVLFVGITEEIVFRGFLLNTFLKRMKTWQAVTLDAILFYLIHIPIWIYQAHNMAFFLSAIVTVIGLSVLFAYSFIKSGSA